MVSGCGDVEVSPREASESDRGAMQRCLAEAFEDDPISAYLFPEVSSRRARLESFYRLILGLMTQQGAIYTDDLVRGVAVWQAPASRKQTLVDRVLGALITVVELRTSSLRALELQRTVARTQITEPHWYLALLGTGPAHQRKGVGSAMLQPILSRCDADGVPAYLESSKEQNIAFYEHHGFRVTQELQVRDGPTLWSMTRTPATWPALNRRAGPAEIHP